jgi:hypothetical protein
MNNIQRIVLVTVALSSLAAAWWCMLFYVIPLKDVS